MTLKVKVHCRSNPNLLPPLASRARWQVASSAVRLYSCVISEGVADAQWIQEGGAEVFEKALRLHDKD